MASTYSDLKIELIGTGEQVGTWGATTNTNLGTALGEAITGSATVTFSSTDVTLTLSNTNGSQTARNLRLVCAGTSGGARQLILDDGCQIEKLYLIQNDLADTVTVINGNGSGGTSGTGIAVPAGGKRFVFNDGTNVVEAININLASGISGTLPVANGGTGQTSYTDGQLLIGNTAGSLTKATITAGSNITVTNGNGSIQIASSNPGGTVTSVGLSAPTGFNVTGSPVTSSGTLALAFAAGYSLPTNTSQSNWDTAYSDRLKWDGGSSGLTASTGRTSLGLGSIATQEANNVAITGGSVTTLTALSCRGPNGVQGNTIMGEGAGASISDPGVNTNTLYGYEAGNSLSAGEFTTAFGYQALSGATTGDNSAFGFQALKVNLTGSQNTAIGNEAMENNVTGSENVALGHQALRNNVTGTQNVALGTYALINNTSANSNVAIGRYALEDVNASNNTAVGDSTLRNVTTSSNTAVGASALFYATTGGSNTGIGFNALSFVLSGSNNTSIGSNAGTSITTGSNNTCVGNAANSSTQSVSNEFTLGNSSVTSLRCNDTTISSLSDGRDKTDIIDNPYGLAFLNTIQPRQFKWQTRDGNIKDGTTRLGFIAQELLEAADGKNDVLDLVYESNPERLEAKPGNLIPILVQAIKELSEKCDSLQAEIDQLKGG